MAWSFIAQRATTGEFLDWDVPLDLGGLEWQLSGPGSLRGTVSPDVGGLRANDGRPILEEWGTLLYAEHDGEIRWGGIVITSSFQGETWNIEAAGFTTYPHARTYRGEYVQVAVDPAEVISHIWTHLQSFPDSDLGVTVIGDTTPVRLGKLAYATDENGNVLDLAVPHQEWDELFELGWIGGPVHKIHVSDQLWSWLINHGFNRVADHPVYGLAIVPPSTWTEDFPWWEAELLSLGWVGGPVRHQDVRPELWSYLTTHGWIGRPSDGIEQVYPPTTEPDKTLYPSDVWVQLGKLQWAGGAVRYQDVQTWVWNRLWELGWTDHPGDIYTIYPPEAYSTDQGLPSFEVQLLNLGWVGGVVRQEDVSENLWETLTEGGWVPDGAGRLMPPPRLKLPLGENDKIVEAEPYQLLWYEAPNCGEEIDTLVKETPLDFVERHRWSADHESVIHEVELGYPRLGRRRDDIVFVQGDNVTEVVPIESNGDDFANYILGLGAGEGRAMLRRETSIRDGRLARDHVYTDKAITDAGRLDALIAEELNSRRAALRIESVSVVDHPNAPIGSWQIGDDVLIRADLPWLGEVEVWCRITGWSLTGDTTATLALTRSDLYRYGG